MKNQFYVTTSIPYVNGNPHMGHALEFLYADVIARYYRLKGYDVRLTTGTDEHGQKVQRAAEAAGVEPAAQAGVEAEHFKRLLEAYNCQYDDFVRTTEPRHEKSAHVFWQKMVDSGDIEKGVYEGLYCVGCEANKTEKDLIDGKCPIHEKTPEPISEENYFFRLSRYADKLLAFYNENPDFIYPAFRMKEMREIIASGLEDVSISRDKSRLSWGVSVPNDDNQVMYVWFEAVMNYVTSVGHGVDDAEFTKWWPADLHIIGKDINRFHTIMWPAMLMAAGLDLPQKVGVHGFITVDGKKMSKSLGNVIDPFALVAQYGVEPIRYFLLREMPFQDDGDFSYERLEARYQADLANGIGNLLSRVSNMIEKYSQGDLDPSPQELDYGKAAAMQYHDLIQKLEFSKALDVIWGLIDEANELIEQEKPWDLAKTDTDRLQVILAQLLYSLELVTEWLEPFMPETVHTMRSVLQRRPMVKAEPLFPRLEITK
ncbi:MAG: methionine--tRNA ligase [Candidatus Kerfeldbacteria bacterium CG15_BIG_FIL_POST_REV_8_21_14_020_45_12]|uniref:Methionine--tRNA ligase n=1 Tax=Candidatus Kerfeldbacteria bacterium CG15_BIG_FIL_POST_REV_8_21_14_020_45_12 TaxID=2014247 RepID=A0A2M7H4I8_9BACT|nr:MAG: methionine--tRNA ligase [Candidatus Kerfeldbacteria bacterium CG15_BIG_FIL_POST_REV_8_21_14_020_45_12]PJA94097.1 MAG: methionine--tRNA ligase [Candidatus Kerfeldbacteria bacterium CG_4_9_14_3_um_filter_45_8]